MKKILFLFLLASCAKEYSQENVAPRCVHFHTLPVIIDLNGHYVYNADLYYVNDTTREYMQYNLDQSDSNYWKSMDHTILCNLKIDYTNSKLLK